jgi:peptidyl-prolyl cis-trans isomerase D
MGTMTKLRENTGVVLWILVIAFGVIWVLQDSGGLDFVGGAAGTNIIVVDGDPITVEEYRLAVDGQVQRYQQQTGESMPPQMLERERERVFEALVEDRLRAREMDRMGIRVTDDELYEMVRGENPHPIILAYFGDGEGNVNHALLDNFIANPEARQDWIQIEDFLRQERRQEKLQNLIAASVRVTDAEVEDEYLRRNRTATVEWVGLRYADVPDSEVELSDRDLRRYYDQNREDFRRERTYDIEYVLMSKMPSAEDSALIARDLERLRSEFAAAEDDSLFLLRQGSERPYSSSWFSADELESELASVVFDNPTAGQIVGPVFAGGSVHLVKIQDVRQAEEPVIRARHILVRSSAADPEVEQRLVDIRNQIEGGASFEAMARQHSQDNTASIGGDLGWFGRGRMVAPFEEAAFGASPGSVVGPVRTTFGYHLIQITDRATSELRLADYAQSVRADVGTIGRIQERLEDLRYYAEDGNFTQEAERLGLPVDRMTVERGQDVIPGIGQSRAFARFLEDASRGDISDAIELDEAFVVAKVASVQREGYRSFDEVRDEIRPRAMLDAKREIQANRMREALEQAGDLSSLASALGTQVRTEASVGFNTQVVSGLGREPKFGGTAFGLSEGARSGVVEGGSAVFVLRATSVQEPAPLSDGQRQNIHTQLLNQRRNQVMNDWITSLRDAARVDDHRSRFLQF